MAFWSNWFNHTNAGSQQASQQQYTHDRFQGDRNPNMEVFQHAQNNIAEIIDRRSVISQDIKDGFDYSYSPLAQFAGITAMPVITNKPERVRIYRQMAQLPECKFCIDEIADDLIHEDDAGQYIKLELPPEKENINELRQTILQNEFDRFIELFHFQDEAFTIMKRLIIDGEVAFENIINPEKPELGIVGIKYLPTEYYETLMDTETGRAVGIFFDTKKLKYDIKNIVSTSCFGSQTVFNNILPSTYTSFSKDNCIPLLWPQVTYFTSGETSPDGLINYSYLENCKQAYHQLALMKDAAVILRVTRAPERLLFNISTGGMSDKVAKDFLRDFVNQMKSKKVVSSVPGQQGGQLDITNVYNPISMLENFYFQKSDANDGTTVESVGSSANYDEIADIEFFMRNLFKSFKVPFSRWKTPENSLEKAESITYEEYDFSRQEMRFQRKIAQGLKRAFITNLKLRGMWKKYELKESDIRITFTPPVLFDLYNKQKLVVAKMDTYKAIVDQDELSKITAMKKYLGMTDEEIEENFRNLIKEKMYVQLAEYYSEQIAEKGGPAEYDPPIKLKDDMKAGAGGGGDEGGEKGGTGDSQDQGDGGDEGGEEGGNPPAPSFGLG